MTAGDDNEPVPLGLVESCLDAAERGSRPGRVKELVVNLFGADRGLGSHATRLHSDLRHVVEFLRRGKHPRLSKARLDALEESLAAARRAADPEASGGAATVGATETASAEPNADFGGLAWLRAQVESWRADARTAFDADSYYDSHRAAGYHERLRGPQMDLTLRTLQLSSLAADKPRTSVSSAELGAAAKGLLLVDLGCGTGLSSALAVPPAGYTMGVIGVDASSEMLRAEGWAEVTAASLSPLAGERLRCDLGQPLPFRAGAFDLAYSVAAVHYVAEHTLTRRAEQRLDAFLGSLRRSLARSALPCTFQAFFTKEPTAVQLFKEASARTGWAICDLVVDRPHGGSGADRDFLYLVHEAPKGAALAPPPSCALHRATGATCALALDVWARGHGLPAPELDDVHREWLWREHHRFARRLVRLQARCSDGEAKLDHAERPTQEDIVQASRLAALLKSEEVPEPASAPLRPLPADLREQLFAELHCPRCPRTDRGSSAQ